MSETCLLLCNVQQEVAPLTSGRLSHSSGPLNGGGSLSDSPPVSPEIDDAKVRACHPLVPNPTCCASDVPVLRFNFLMPELYWAYTVLQLLVVFLWLTCCWTLISTRNHRLAELAVKIIRVRIESRHCFHWPAGGRTVCVWCGILYITNGRVLSSRVEIIIEAFV
jgi:hypothetical protein